MMGWGWNRLRRTTRWDCGSSDPWTSAPSFFFSSPATKWSSLLLASSSVWEDAPAKIGYHFVLTDEMFGRALLPPPPPPPPHDGAGKKQRHFFFAGRISSLLLVNPRPSSATAAAPRLVENNNGDRVDRTRINNCTSKGIASIFVSAFGCHCSGLPRLSRWTWLAGLFHRSPQLPSRDEYVQKELAATLRNRLKPKRKGREPATEEKVVEKNYI